MENSITTLKKRLCGRKLAIYGMDCNVFELLKVLEQTGEVQVDFFVDRKSATVERAFGRDVKNKSCLLPQNHFCIISPIHYFQEIAAELNGRGFLEEKDYCYSTEFRQNPINIDGVTIGKHSIGWGAYMSCLGRSTADCIESIGSYCSINRNSQISVNHNFLLTTSNELFKQHAPHTATRTSSMHNQVVIGNDVWIGANTFINASKVKSIGDGAVIGAGAVVIEDVPPYAIVAGVPAKVKKYRFTPKQIEVLLRVRWWEWPDEEIAANIELFYDYGLFFAKYR